MIEIEKPRIETEEISQDGTYGKFIVEPLERGFGTTLGNSLRRVLISSLPGVVVQSIKIDGVVHEFSTIPGVKEDVTEIILNIKGLIASCTVTWAENGGIVADGPCDVTAASIKCDSEVEILNPGLHIATLGEGAKLYMEITLNRGRGYVPVSGTRKACPPGLSASCQWTRFYPGAEGQFQRRKHPRRSEHRLRPPDPRGVDERRDQRAGIRLSSRRRS